MLLLTRSTLPEALPFFGACTAVLGRLITGMATSEMGPGRVKTFSSPKNCTQPSVIHFDATVCAYFAVSSQESIRAQPRATQNDLNGHTARTTVHAPQARIAARSGLIPTMFITRVRL